MSSNNSSSNGANVLRRDIESAFKSGHSLGADSLHDAYLIYQNGGTLGDTSHRIDERSDWSKVGAEYVDKYWQGLTYLDRQSLLFYLPRLMVYLLDENDSGSQEDILDLFFFVLLHSIENEKADEFLATLKGPQQSAIQEFLRHSSRLTNDVTILRKRDKILAKLDS